MVQSIHQYIMPSSASAEEKPKKRVTKKRASGGTKTVRKTVAKKAVRKKTTRKRMSTTKANTPASVSSDERKAVAVNRKAPTSIAVRRATVQTKRRLQIIFFSVLIVSIGLSAAVGLTDDGHIDVNKAIEERNERIRSGQLGENDRERIFVPVQNTEANKLPDGGLVGLGVGAAPPAPAPEPATTTASSTASTTDDTASSTNDGTSPTAETVEDPVGVGDEEKDDELEEVDTPLEVSGGEVIEVTPTSGR